jgi:hypothetical protein
MEMVFRKTHSGILKAKLFKKLNRNFLKKSFSKTELNLKSEKQDIVFQENGGNNMIYIAV